MATIAAQSLSLADVARRLDPNGKTDSIVELINKKREILDDAMFVEANDGTKHKTTVRTGLPTPTWRKLYGGVLPSKTSTAQVTDSCGMLHAITKVDADVVDKSKTPEKTLLTEQTGHMEALRREVERTLFYGDTAVNEEQFHGLSARYSIKNTTNDDTISPYNVLSAAGVGADNTSVYLIGWGEVASHMLYPQGSMAGIKMTNKGKLLTAQDGDLTKGEFEAYVSTYKWDVGFSCRDWRSIGRIANLDISDLEGSTGTQNAQQLLRLMIQLEERVVFGGAVCDRYTWVMHPRVATVLRLQYLEKMAGNMTWETIAGKRVMAFGGNPIRRSEQLSLAEAAI